MIEKYERNWLDILTVTSQGLVICANFAKSIFARIHTTRGVFLKANETER